MYPTLYTDPITGVEALIAGDRFDRPNALVKPVPRPPTPPEECPFCPGHEDQTPPEHFATGEADRAPNTPGWQIRVIPNKYPMVQEGLDGAIKAERWRFLGGRQEVVIETPEHERRWHETSPAELGELMSVIADRMAAISRGKVFLGWFKNEGADAGATQTHPHSQLIALDEDVPPIAQSMIDIGKAHRSCPVCDHMFDERKRGDRVIGDIDGYTMVAPWASRLPFEVRIFPPHEGAFLAGGDSKRLGVVLSDVVCRIERALDGPPVNVVLRTVPMELQGERWAHWFLEVTPRLTRFAGFELMSGWMINSVAPERAAEVLRGVRLD